MAYKSYLIQKEKATKNQLTSQLHENLINKNYDNFWKTWNSKFGKTRVVNKIVDGETDGQLITNNFVKYFASVYETDQLEKNKFCTEFKNRFQSYTGSKIDIEFSIGKVDKIKRNLKK